jgi:phosphotriesterase-related protein
VAALLREEGATVVALVERGYADRLVLSHDASCYVDWADPTLLPLVLPNWHYRHMHGSVLPSLRERGVTEEQIKMMLVANPRRFFEG